MSLIIGNDPQVQLDALVIWPQASHSVGAVTGAYVQVLETTYNSSMIVTDRWMRAFFDESDTAVTLTIAGTTDGQTVSGTIDFPADIGFAYTADLL